MKKRDKKDESSLVDLNDRNKIKIIHSTKPNVTYKNMEEFEERLKLKYDNYNEFTDFCINEKLQRLDQISKQLYVDALESMLEQNKLLKDMIKEKEQGK